MGRHKHVIIDMKRHYRGMKWPRLVVTDRIWRCGAIQKRQKIRLEVSELVPQVSKIVDFFFWMVHVRSIYNLEPIRTRQKFFLSLHKKT